MTPILLTLTHALAAFAGGALVYVIMVRNMRARNVNGHLALEWHPDDDTDPQETTVNTPTKRHLTGPVTIILAALFVIGIGTQAWLWQKHDAAQDREDREYADCLSNFAADLVETIETRTKASAKLERATERKSEALDNLIVVLDLARQTPPKATDDQFTMALERRLAAQRHYDDVQAQLEAVRDDNPYTSPKVVCER